MKHLFACAFTFALLAATADSYAQPLVQLLNLKAQYYPSTPYANGSGKLNVTQYEGSFLLPMVQKNEDVVLVGGDYTQLNFSNGASRMKLHSASLALGYEKHFSSKWKAAVLALPKINSDFKDVNHNDMQYGGLAIVTYKKRDNLKYRFGMYYNHECFGNYAMPLLGIDWKATKRLNVFGDLPANMNVEYKLSKSIYIGASYISIVGSYRLQSSEGNSYVRVGDKTFGQNEFKGFVNYYLTKHLVWYAEAGYTAGRMYQRYDSQNRLQANDAIYQRNADGPFMNTGVAFCFRLDEQQ